MTDLPIIEQRGWPHDVPWPPPKDRPGRALRLGSRIALVLHIAAGPRTFSDSPIGLGAYMIVAGRSIIEAGLIIPDGISNAHWGWISSWVRRHPIDTIRGPLPWHVRPCSEFFEPYRGPFTRTVYAGRAMCIGADLGSSLALGAAHWHPRAEPHSDTWVLWLPGWGREHERGRWKRVSPHRPCLYLTPRRVGWQVSFGPVERGNGKWHHGAPWPGDFVDLYSLAYALDADRGASYSEHRANFGLEPQELPIAVTCDTYGAMQITQAILGLHEFALTLDRYASCWFPKRRHP
jgi:hypothetical protein